jgi:hypothetical protein
VPGTTSVHEIGARTDSFLCSSCNKVVLEATAKPVGQDYWPSLCIFDSHAVSGFAPLTQQPNPPVTSHPNMLIMISKDILNILSGHLVTQPCLFPLRPAGNAASPKLFSKGPLTTTASSPARPPARAALRPSRLPPAAAAAAGQPLSWAMVRA